MKSGRKWLKFGIISAAAVVLIPTTAVSAIALGPQTSTRRRVVLRLYDLNCSAPFRTYRYPRSVVWLAAGDPLGRGSWKTVFTCRVQ